MAALGGVTFGWGESAIADTDTRWQMSPTVSRRRPLGSARDVIRTMAIGSEDRSFEMMLSPARFALVRALVGVVSFTDWDNPANTRSVFVARVNPIRVPTRTADQSLMLMRVRVELISQ